MKRRGKRMAALAAAVLLLAGGATQVAFGAEPPDALFRGGSGHGYDEERDINTTDTRRSRNHGGARDGYAMAPLADVKVTAVPSGTVIMIR